MSRYDARTSRVMACVRGIKNTVLPAWEQVQLMIIDGLDHAVLQDLAAEARETAHTANSLDHVAQTWVQVEQAIPAMEALPEELLGEFAAFASDLETAQDAGYDESMDESVADDLGLRLADLLNGTAGVFGSVERLTKVEAARHALEDLEYEVVRADSDRVSAIEAWRGTDLVLLTFDDDGAISTDWAVSGGCGELQSEIHEAMERYGVEIGEEFRVEHHDDPRGGRLIAAASRHGGSRAEGAVAELERNRSATGSLYGGRGGRVQREGVRR